MAAFSFAILASAILLLFNPANVGANTISEFLDPQNAIRARHGVPPLRWNQKLANYASWYANLRSVDCKLEESDSNYGENVFWGQGNQWTIADAVRAWGSQVANYDYQTNTCKPGQDCLHYTQIVWRSTRWVGCARTTCRSGDTFIVCEYDPHGNVLGLKPY